MADETQHAIICGECRLRFMVPESFWQHCQDDARNWFYCPNGHQQHFVSDANNPAALRRERDRLKQEQAWYAEQLSDERRGRKMAERQVSAARGQITKLRKRAGAGLCPCCNRSFRQLSLHMKHKHPDFTAEVIELEESA
jgi:hypothetical protein